MVAKHFKPEEVVGLDAELVQMLDWAREKAGIAFVITSGLRDGDPRAHGRGHAVDLRCRRSRARLKIVQALLDVGFRRIGIYDKHVHADNDPSLPQSVMWWGVSD